ncbi:MAG: YjbF family lipoprotein [Paracoccus sp. (in: a-proteobacteria)]|nr:YjbF family lipoprotein [Paracoccus sp. (in: a-proteobacteria)]
MSKAMKPMIGLLAAVALAGCASKSPEQQGAGADGIGTALKAVAMQRIAKAKGAAPAPARDPSAIAADALAANSKPLILVGLESQGTTQALALVQENAGMRTYMTSGSQAVILRGGMLAGTKGLGHDLSVAEMGPSAALIRAGQTGSASRVMRYVTGEGIERPLPLGCQIGRGPKPGVMVEDCTAPGVSFQNSYLLSGGAISVSRQWIGPDLGYMTIQVLRP